MARRRSGRRGPKLTTFQALAVASQFGFTLAAGVGLGLFAGRWLDERIGTAFVFTLLGVFLGLATAVSTTVRLYRTVLRRAEADEDDQISAGGDTTLAEDHTEG